MKEYNSQTSEEREAAIKELMATLEISRDEAERMNDEQVANNQAEKEED